MDIHDLTRSTVMLALDQSMGKLKREHQAPGYTAEIPTPAQHRGEADAQLLSEEHHKL